MADWLISALVMVMVFAAVVLVVMAMAPLFAKRVDLDARLSGVRQAAVQSNNTLRTDDHASPWAKLIAAVERRGLSLTDSKGDALAQRLMLAGFEQPWAVRAFVLARTVLTLAIPTLVVLVIAATGAWPTPSKLYMIILGAAVFGLYLPNLIVDSRGSNRKEEILNGFPDTLDLMLVCVEAGLGIDASFSRVGAEIVGSHPLLADLFATASLELRAGRSREQALRTLATRTAVPEIGTFVTLIIQSDKLGASIGQALKIYASEMREARRMRAEEKAMRIPVLLSVPLVCFLLPVMVSVLMLPAAIQMKHGMAKANASAPK
ncbi:MAG: type II secretion system F family protein [Sandarakinorhabdus sp.]|nr:type II secretion system F family protein [Sandarakinorhabdus sp.]